MNENSKNLFSVRLKTDERKAVDQIMQMTGKTKNGAIRYALLIAASQIEEKEPRSAA